MRPGLARAGACPLAPRDGRVVTVVTNVGQNAAPGRILASIVDLHDLFVRVYVPETRIGTVSVGQAVSVSSDSGGAAIAGTVSFVSEARLRGAGHHL